MNKDYTLCFYRSDAKIGCNKVDLEPEKAKTKMPISRGFQTITATCHNYHIKSLGCDWKPKHFVRIIFVIFLSIAVTPVQFFETAYKISIAIFLLHIFNMFYVPEMCEFYE